MCLKQELTESNLTCTRSVIRDEELFWAVKRPREAKGPLVVKPTYLAVLSLIKGNYPSAWNEGTTQNPLHYYGPGTISTK